MDASSAHGDLRLYEFAKSGMRRRRVETMTPKLLVTGRDLIAADIGRGRSLGDAGGRGEAQLDGAT